MTLPSKDDISQVRVVFIDGLYYLEDKDGNLTPGINLPLPIQPKFIDEE